jgi:hypothetical protein
MLKSDIGKKLKIAIQFKCKFYIFEHIHKEDILFATLHTIGNENIVPLKWIVLKMGNIY